MRLLILLMSGLAAAIAAWLLRAPEPAVLLAGGLGALAGWALWGPNRELPPLPERQEDPLPATLLPAHLIEAIDEPVLLIDRQRVAEANLAARRLLGEHIVGQDVRLAIRHPAAAEQLTAPPAPAGHGPIELVGLGDRQRRWVFTAHALGEGRRLVRLTDRTDAYAAERMRVDFVANASHELRTPLATIIGFLETLEDRNAAEDAPTRARFLKIMAGEARRMQRLVEDLISLSRIEAEKFTLPQQPLPLQALVEEARSAAGSGSEEVLARILVEADPQAPPVVGDKVQLAQLVQNLVGNALKYGRPDTPVTVSVRAAAGNMVRLCVADEGEGIAAEHLPRLTERFYRVDPSRSRSVGGTGLGLSIVKHIVERHRGRLDIDSVVGRGTRVTVLLPAALSWNGHAIVTEEASPPVSGEDERADRRAAGEAA